MRRARMRRHPHSARMQRWSIRHLATSMLWGRPTDRRYWKTLMQRAELEVSRERSQRRLAGTGFATGAGTTVPGETETGSA